MFKGFADVFFHVSIDDDHAVSEKTML